MGLIPSQVVFNDFHPRQLDVPLINVRVGPTVFSWCSLNKILGATFFVGFSFVGIISNSRGKKTHVGNSVLLVHPTANQPPPWTRVTESPV